MVRNIPRKEEDKINDEYCNSASECPPGGLFISNTFEGVELNRDGGLFQGGGGYLNLANMMVSIFHKDPGYKLSGKS